MLPVHSRLNHAAAGSVPGALGQHDAISTPSIRFITNVVVPTSVEFPPQRRSKPTGHIRLAIHRSFDHVFVFYNQCDLRVTVTLMKAYKGYDSKFI